MLALLSKKPTHINPLFRYKHDLTLEYLINSCGLSESAAISASYKLHIKSPERPDSVLNLLKNYGFSNTQIPILISKAPHLLLYDSQQTLKPKFEYFKSLGFTSSDLSRLLTSDSSLLQRSLENQIIPSFDFLKALFHNDEHVRIAVKRCSRILKLDPNKYLAINIDVLRNHGVHETRLLWLVRSHPGAIMQVPDQFVEIVNTVIDLGIAPSSFVFLEAIHAFAAMSKSTWDNKCEVFLKWGWSEDEILEAFRKFPNFMKASEKKIEEMMEFLVNKMGFDSSYLVKCPCIMGCSLEKRVKPRCLIVQLLKSKGLVKKVSLSTVISMGDKLFLEKFVTAHRAQVPELLNLYGGRVESDVV